ncbi:putative secreted protein [Enhygromyxa salina]|uniref:Putative secreted protein n=1 Tax=Enhygromyxa salina TaxID=215803 RepID=A0A0C1ZQ03_9BACT|nr:DUF4360 domain-containing protein [Enhygromyxa salina]KIG19664.1 putative secreted protein [Enhygromyxa salina]
MDEPESTDDLEMSGVVVEPASEDVLVGDALERGEPNTQVGPNDVYIEEITTNGIGCPYPGSAVAVLSSDQKSFIVIFNDMLLQNPPPPPVKTTNCVAAVKLHVPKGFQVSVSTVNTKGYAFLEKGLKATQTSNYFLAGVPLGLTYQSVLQGYFDDFYNFTDVFGVATWSKCGEAVLIGINTTLNLNAIKNPYGNGIINTTTVDGKFQKIFHINKKPC